MTPDAVKYQMTLENEQRLRMRTWRAGDDDIALGDGPATHVSWSDFAFTPTSRLVLWLLRRPHQRWRAAIAALLVVAYLAVAYGLWHGAAQSDAMALLAVFGVAVALWNAAKFGVAGIVCATRRR